MKESLKRGLKWGGTSVLLAFVALQVSNPSHQNPPVVPGHDALASNAPPSTIVAMLHNSCYDCHSFETRWPWYSYVAPVSWLVAKDIKAARAGLNFSEWPWDDPSHARKRWRHIGDAIENGEMPIANYTLMHREAILTDLQKKELVTWARAQGGSSE
jgi:hypothetical protein